MFKMELEKNAKITARKSNNFLREWLWKSAIIKSGIPRIKFGKYKVKLSLFTDGMMLYTENPEDATRKLLKLINEFSKLIHRNVLHTCTLIIKY